MKKRFWWMARMGLLGLCVFVCQSRAKAQLRYLAQAPARPNCGTPLPGTRVFSGQIEGTPSRGTFLVRNGSTSVWITYSNSVLDQNSPIFLSDMLHGTCLTSLTLAFTWTCG